MNEKQIQAKILNMFYFLGLPRNPPYLFTIWTKESGAKLISKCIKQKE